MDRFDTSLEQPFKLQNNFWPHLRAHRLHQKNVLKQEVKRCSTLVDNFLTYTIFDDQSEASGGGRNHLGLMNLDDVQKNLRAAVYYQERDAGLSDTAYVDHLLGEIWHAWKRGSMDMENYDSGRSFMHLAGVIIAVFDVVRSGNLLPYILFHGSPWDTVQKTRILAVYLHARCDDFWAPDHTMDVWLHLQHICDAFCCSEIFKYSRVGVEGSCLPGDRKRFVSSRTWELMHPLIDTKRRSNLNDTDP